MGDIRLSCPYMPILSCHAHFLLGLYVPLSVHHINRAMPTVVISSMQYKFKIDRAVSETAAPPGLIVKCGLDG